MQPQLEVRSVRGHGRGVYAASFIPAGTILLHDWALAEVHHGGATPSTGDSISPEPFIATSNSPQSLFLELASVCNSDRGLLSVLSQMAPNGEEFAFALQKVQHYQHAADMNLADAYFSALAPLEHRMLPRNESWATPSRNANSGHASSTHFAGVFGDVVSAMGLGGGAGLRIHKAPQSVLATIPKGASLEGIRERIKAERASSFPPFDSSLIKISERDIATPSSSPTTTDLCSYLDDESIPQLIEALAEVEVALPNLSRSELIRLFLVVKCNSFELTTEQSEFSSSPSSPFPASLRNSLSMSPDSGRGIFPLGSLMNHSCFPNAGWVCTSVPQPPPGQSQSSTPQKAPLTSAHVKDALLVSDNEECVGATQLFAHHHRLRLQKVSNTYASKHGGTPTCIVFHALRDIAPGEQVYISYLDPFLPPRSRHITLLRGYGFRCTCPRCEGSLSPSPCSALLLQHGTPRLREGETDASELQQQQQQQRQQRNSLATWQTCSQLEQGVLFVRASCARSRMHAVAVGVGSRRPLLSSDGAIDVDVVKFCAAACDHLLGGVKCSPHWEKGSSSVTSKHSSCRGLLAPRLGVSSSTSTSSSSDQDKKSPTPDAAADVHQCELCGRQVRGDVVAMTLNRLNSQITSIDSKAHPNEQWSAQDVLEDAAFDLDTLVSEASLFFVAHHLLVLRAVALARAVAHRLGKHVEAYAAARHIERTASLVNVRTLCEIVLRLPEGHPSLFATSMRALTHNFLVLGPVMTHAYREHILSLVEKEMPSREEGDVSFPPVPMRLLGYASLHLVRAAYSKSPAEPLCANDVAVVASTTGISFPCLVGMWFLALVYLQRRNSEKPAPEGESYLAASRLVDAITFSLLVCSPQIGCHASWASLLEPKNGRSTRPASYFACYDED